MKKFLSISLVLLLTLTLFLSCSSTEKEDKYYEEIQDWAVGTWVYEDETFYNYFDITKDNIEYVLKVDKVGDYGYYAFEDLILSEEALDYYDFTFNNVFYKDEGIYISTGNDEYTIEYSLIKDGNNKLKFSESFYQNGQEMQDVNEITFTKADVELPILPSSFSPKFLWENTDVYSYMSDTQYFELIIDPNEIYLYDVAFEYVYELASFNYYYQGEYIEENVTENSYELKINVFDENYNPTEGVFRVEKDGDNMKVNFIVPGYIELVDYIFEPVFYKTE